VFMEALPRSEGVVFMVVDEDFVAGFVDVEDAEERGTDLFVIEGGMEDWVVVICSERP